MIRNIRRGRRFVESADRIASVNDIIDAIEEYSGERYTKSELENKKAMCSVYSKDHGGQQVLVCLRGNTLTCYYYNLNSVVDDCVEKTAHALSGEDPENIPAIMEELMTYLEESWTDDLDMYGRISIPCSKDALFSCFESSCEEVDNYILHLADSHCYDVQELLESSEDDDEYEEKRSRREARNRMRSRLNRRHENCHVTRHRRFESGGGLDFEEAQNHLESFLALPYVSVLFEGKRFLLLRLCNDGVHKDEILVDTANAEYGDYLAYYNRFRNDSPAREGDDSPRDNEMLLDRDVKSYYDKHVDTEFTPSVFSYASNASEYRVLYFPDKGYARSVLFEGDEGLPYILKRAGWFGDEAKKIFGR